MAGSEALPARRPWRSRVVEALLMICVATTQFSIRADEPESATVETPALTDPDEISDSDNPIRPASLLQPRPLLIPQQEATPNVPLPSTARSRLPEEFTSRRGPSSVFGVSAARGSRVGGSTVPASDGRARSTTDAGSLLDRSPSALGVGVQRRNPIVSDPRIRGSRVGSLAASGSYWVPARMDLDTMLNKIDSRIVSDITVIKGPYSALYGPGSNFVDVQLMRTPRFEDSEVHGSTSGDYKTNGEQWYGRQTFWGGDENYGFRAGYGQRGGDDYQSGNGTSIPAGYKSRDFDFAFGYDFSPDSHVEFNYLRLDQTDVLFPGQAFDINDLVTDAFELSYELANQELFDRLSIDTWYNRTRFNGDTNRGTKRPQFPLYDFLGFQARTDVDSLSTGFRAATTWDHGEHSSTTAGVDLRAIRQELNELAIAPGLGITTLSNSPIPRSNTANPGLFFEHVESPTDQLHLTFGSRLDFVNATLNADSASIAALGLSSPQASLANLLGTSQFDRSFTLYSMFLTSQYDIDEQWKLTAAAGQGQRAPNLTELYAAGPFMFLLQNGLNTVTGDPRLKSEKIWQIDLGTQFKSEQASFGVTGFHAWCQDYITFENVSVVRGPPLGAIEQVNLQFVNTDLATLAGFEAHGDYHLNSWMTPFATVNFVEGRDHTRNGNFATIPGSSGAVKSRDTTKSRGANSGIAGRSEEPLPQILPLQARLGMRLHQAADRPRWNVELSARIADRQNRVATSLLEQQTSGFTTLDLRGVWQATDKLLLVAGVENFTNKQFQEHLDYRPQPGGGTFRVFQPGANFYFGSELKY